MTQPHRHAVPRTVTDVLLWLLATDVAAAHRPHPDRPGRCANLRCTGQAHPCPPACDAHRACRSATRPGLLARGRASVATPAATTAARFAGWFRPARPLTPLPRPIPAPTGETYQCPPPRNAQRARRATNRPTLLAFGHARVAAPAAAAATRFAGWFHSTTARPTPPQQRPAPAPRAA